MPFYQMLCITAHYNEYVRHVERFSTHTYSSLLTQMHIKGLVTQAAKHVMDKGGVVRRLNSWGTFALPQRMRRHKKYYNVGE